MWCGVGLGEFPDESESGEKTDRKQSDCDDSHGFPSDSQYAQAGVDFQNLTRDASAAVAGQQGAEFRDVVA